MKKLGLILVLFMCIALTSCGNKETRVAVSDNPEASINAALNLEELKNGVSLNSNLDKTQKSYVDVKVASNIKDSLFYDVIEIEEYLGEDFKGVNLNYLRFSNKIFSTDIVNFFAELNNKDYGITEEKLGIDFTTDSNSGSLLGKLNTTNFASLPSEYDVDSEKVSAVAVVYLPVYCIYHEGSQDYTKAYLLVPVFYSYTFVNNGVVEDANFAGINNYKVTLNENGLLPSATE